MWLLKLHISFSVLCMLTFLGFQKICREVIAKNGWSGNKKKKPIVLSLWIFFIPILNILCVILLFVMIGVKKEDWDIVEAEGERKGKGA